MIEKGSVEFILEGSQLGRGAPIIPGQGGNQDYGRALARLEASFRASKIEGASGRVLGSADIRRAIEATRQVIPPAPGGVFYQRQGQHAVEIGGVEDFSPKARIGKPRFVYKHWGSRSPLAGSSPMSALGKAKALATGNVRGLVGKLGFRLGSFYAGAFVGGAAIGAIGDTIGNVRQNGLVGGLGKSAYSAASGLISPVADIAEGAAMRVAAGIGKPRTELQMQRGMERVAAGIFGPFANNYLQANIDRRKAWVAEREKQYAEAHAKLLDSNATRLFSEAFTATWNERIRTGFKFDPDGAWSTLAAQSVITSRHAASVVLAQRARAQAFKDARIEELNGGVLVPSSEKE